MNVFSILIYLLIILITIFATLYISKLIKSIVERFVKSNETFPIPVKNCHSVFSRSDKFRDYPDPPNKFIKFVDDEGYVIDLKNLSVYFIQ